MDSRPKILVVDDTKIVLEGTAMTIEAFGFDVDKASGAQVALSLFKTGRYVAIVMDCNMPVKNGFECAKEIRMLEGQSGTRIPIIGFSSSSDKGIKEQCLNAGMDTFLPKDCTRTEMEEVLIQWAGKPRAAGPHVQAQAKIGNETVLTIGQIEAISEFFEGQQNPDVELNITGNAEEQSNLYFSVETNLYRCFRVSPTKWRVISFEPNGINGMDSGRN